VKDEKPSPRHERSAPVDWEEVKRLLALAAPGEALTPPPDEKRKILKGRARELSREMTAGGGTGESAEVVELRVADERYGVESCYVHEVYPLKEMTWLPGTPPFVLGITNVRGRIVAVNDLRRFFSLPGAQTTAGGKLVILGNEAMEFGVLADEVVGVRSIPLAELQPPLRTLTGNGAKYLRGITGDRLALLDAEKILSDRRIVINEEAEL
jgi:purine-binding chemotaxis protein CheW